MGLVDGQVVGRAVDLAGGGEHHLRARRPPPQPLQQVELNPAIELQVGHRVGHRVQVAGLAGQVEHHLLPRQDAFEQRRVAEVPRLEVQPMRDPLDVVAQPPLIGPQRIDERHHRAQVHQAPGEVGADEAEAARHQHAGAREGKIRLRHLRSLRSAPEGRSPPAPAGPARPPSRRGARPWPRRGDSRRTRRRIPARARPRPDSPRALAA